MELELKRVMEIIPFILGISSPQVHVEEFGCYPKNCGRPLIDFKQDKDMTYFEFRLLCLLGEEYIRKGKRLAVI